MAIGTPALLKDNGAITTSGQTTVAVSGVVIAAGTLVKVMVACGNASTAVGDPTGVVDNAGSPNTYIKADSASRTPTPQDYESEWYFYDTAGGTRTITVTLAASSNYTHVVVIGTPGAAAVSPLDVIGGGDQGGTTTVALISVGNVAQNDEASVGGIMWSTATALSTWPPTGYTSLINVTNATRSHGHACAYKTPLTSVGAQETFSNQVILGGTTGWAGAFGTYKGAAAGGTVVRQLAALGAG